MRRLLALGMLAAAGCGSEGSYELRWTFTGGPGVDGMTARECGLRGVDALAIAGSNGDGDNHSAVLPCGRLRFLHHVPVGEWRLSVHALDRTGAEKEPAPESESLKATVTFRVNEDETTPVEVELLPQPECRDGVDNDLDGAVDLADPGCQGNREGPSESG